MIVYLMRHSIAVKEGEDGPQDLQRSLTDEGKEKANEVACGLEHILDPEDLPQVIYTSPAKRCVETAEIVQSHWEAKPELKEVPQFSEGKSVPAMVHYLEKAKQVPTMVVGHKPDLSALLGDLIGAENCEGIDFKRTSVAKIEFKETVKAGQGELCWLYNPWITRQFS